MLNQSPPSICQMIIKSVWCLCLSLIIYKKYKKNWGSPRVHLLHTQWDGCPPGCCWSVPLDILQPGRLAKVDELVVDEAILPPSGLSSPLAPSTRRRRQWNSSRFEGWRDLWRVHDLQLQCPDSLAEQDHHPRTERDLPRREDPGLHLQLTR